MEGKGRQGKDTAIVPKIKANSTQSVQCLCLICNHFLNLLAVFSAPQLTDIVEAFLFVTVLQIFLLLSHLCDFLLKRYLVAIVCDRMPLCASEVLHDLRRVCEPLNFLHDKLPLCHRTDALFADIAGVRLVLTLQEMKG